MARLEMGEFEGEGERVKRKIDREREDEKARRREGLFSQSYFTIIRATRIIHIIGNFLH